MCLIIKKPTSCVIYNKTILQGVLPSQISTYYNTVEWPYAQHLINSCLKRNPDERPSFFEILSLLEDIQATTVK